MSESNATANANRLLRLYAECPSLIQTAPVVALRALCSELDPQGEFANLSAADLRTVVLEWSQDEYNAGLGSHIP